MIIKGRCSKKMAAEFAACGDAEPLTVDIGRATYTRPVGRHGGIRIWTAPAVEVKRPDGSEPSDSEKARMIERGLCS